MFIYVPLLLHAFSWVCLLSRCYMVLLGHIATCSHESLFAVCYVLVFSLLVVSLLILALVAVESCQVIAAACRVGMVGAQDLLANLSATL